MPSIFYQNNTYHLDSGETVLDALLREGHAVPHSCKSGLCHSCLMRAEQGQPPANSQVGLRDTLITRNHFLACLCRPEEDLVVEDPAADETWQSRILDLDSIGVDILRLRLELDSQLEFIPGQFMTLLRSDGLARSYSIASLPQDGFLEFHIRKIPGGLMSTWLHEDIQTGDTLSIRGPYGNCFYIPGQTDQPLLLAGTGTGLAPLIGIIRDALQQGHQGPIHLIHGGLSMERIYLVESLREMESMYDCLTYQPAVLHGPVGPGIHQEPADQLALDWVKNHPQARVFLCGAPEFVNPLRKRLFLGGISMKNIYADAFVMAKPETAPVPRN